MNDILRWLDDLSKEYDDYDLDCVLSSRKDSIIAAIRAILEDRDNVPTKSTVWVVEQGAYSDYHVVGVYSVREDAERMVETINSKENQNSYDKASFSEWPLNPWINEIHQGLAPYYVAMARNGAVNACERRDVGDLFSYLTTPKTPDRLWCEKVWARDEQHAIKIANEHRIQLLATGQWDNA